MPGAHAFFSFAEVTDPARHADYNAWHQLDHRPENLALDGVTHGERWVLSPDCARAGSTPDARLGDPHYVNMYWFRAPVEDSVREWQALAETSFQWGRRPDVGWSRRPLMGFFTPVRGYVSSRVLVSPAALPYRPCLGVHVTLWELETPHSPAAERAFARMDRERLPALLEQPSVAGAWTFTSAGTTLDPGFGAEEGDTTFHHRPGDAGRFRVELVYLDGDPVEATPGLRADAIDGPLRRLFAAPLRTITPWQWDWFDPPGA
jgi:hypothetical protein